MQPVFHLKVEQSKTCECGDKPVANNQCQSAWMKINVSVESSIPKVYFFPRDTGAGAPVGMKYTPHVPVIYSLALFPFSLCPTFK